MCKKIRQQSAFSNRQLQEVRKRLAVAGGHALSGSGIAACRDCIGGQTVELTCIICDRTKSLEFFSKAQRSDPDNAVGSPLSTGCAGIVRSSYANSATCSYIEVQDLPAGPFGYRSDSR